MADVKREAEEAEQEPVIFGYNDRRYGDLKLRLIVSDPSALTIHGLQDNDSTATTIAKLSESAGNNVLLAKQMMS